MGDAKTEPATPESSSVEAELATRSHVKPAQEAAKKSEVQAAKDDEKAQDEARTEAKKEGGEDLVASLTDSEGRIHGSETLNTVHSRTDIAPQTATATSEDERARIANRFEDPDAALAALRRGVKEEDLEEELASSAKSSTSSSSKSSAKRSSAKRSSAKRSSAKRSSSSKSSK